MADEAGSELVAVTAAQWAGRVPPSLEEMEGLAEQAFAALPKSFRELCEGVVIQVREFAAKDVLKELEAHSAYEVLGLFTGIGLAHGGASPETGQLPNTIELYRQPILAYWFESEETLGGLISHILVHEIGHHFGLSDEDMDAIDNAPD